MKMLDFILDLLYPRRCAFCRALTDNPSGICKNCGRKLPYLPDSRQGRALDGICACYSALRYEGTVRESILRYKFSGVAAYAKPYGEILAKCIDENDISCDIITWAPLSRKRLRRRGYDQARLLAEAAAEHLGVPCVQLLHKTRNNRAQSSLKNAMQRRENVSGVYAPVHPELAAQRTVLLVDDIVTTGATLSACADVLQAAGPKKILALTLACKID